MKVGHRNDVPTALGARSAQLSNGTLMCARCRLPRPRGPSHYRSPMEQDIVRTRQCHLMIAGRSVEDCWLP